jgi:hypothetical protein
VSEAFAALPEIKMEIVIAKHATYLLADFILTVSMPSKGSRRLSEPMCQVCRSNIQFARTKTIITRCPAQPGKGYCSHIHNLKSLRIVGAIALVSIVLFSTSSRSFGAGSTDSGPSLKQSLSRLSVEIQQPISMKPSWLSIGVDPMIWRERWAERNLHSMAMEMQQETI